MWEFERSSPALIAAVLASSMTGCGEEEHRLDCASIDPSVAPISGSIRLDYDGWVGHAPSDGVDELYLGVRSESAEHVRLEGCGYRGDDFWFVDLHFRVPVTTPAPVAIDPTIEAGPSALAFLYSSPAADSATYRRVTLSALGGQVDVLDPVNGRLIADATLSKTLPNSPEPDTLHAEVDISWVSRYQPILKGSLDGLWHLVTTERYPGVSEDIELWLELVQDGPLVNANLCDAAGACEPSNFQGTFADPVLEATVTLPGDPTVECNKVQLTLDESQESLTGELHCPARGYWFVALNRE